MPVMGGMRVLYGIIMIWDPCCDQRRSCQLPLQAARQQTVSQCAWFNVGPASVSVRVRHL